MNVFSIINKLKDSFLKEAVSLKKYRQPDITQDEKDKPFSSYVPPVAGGGLIPPKKQSPATGGDLSVDKSPISNSNIGNSPVVQKKDTIAKTVPQFLQVYKVMFNKEVSDFSSRNPITNYQIIEEIFKPFLLEQRESLENNLDLPNWENRLEALKLFEEVFNNEIRGHVEGESVPEDSIDRRQYPDLSDKEMRNLIERNISSFAGGMGGRSKALKQIATLPEIVQNDANSRLFERIKTEYQGSINQSELTDQDRKDLIKIFMDSYLNTAKAKNPQEKAKIQSRLMALMPDMEKDPYLIPEKDDFERSTRKKPKVRGRRRDEAEDILDAPREDFAKSFQLKKESAKPVPVINPFDFIEKELFQPDSLNKELFLSFFLEKGNTGLIPVEDYSDPRDSAILRDQSGTYKSEAMGLVQQHSKELAEILKGIMTNPNDPNHDKFFSWVLNEIRRFGIRKEDPRNTVEESSAVDSDGKAMGGTLTSSDVGFASEFRLPLSKNVIFEEGLKNTGPKVIPGKTVDLDTIESFKQNAMKFIGFVSDMLKNMEEVYSTSDNKDLKKAILERLVYWGRVKRSCEDSAKVIIGEAESSNRTGKNLTDRRSILILNQNWDDFFKKEHFIEYGWNLEDSPDISSAVNLAIRDKLLPIDGGFIQDPNQAYEEMFGGIDISDRGAANKILNRSRGKLPLLKDLIINPELIQKYDRDTLISFLDVIGIPPDSISIGALLAKNNKGSFENKMNYLSELSRKGVIQKNDAEIENMSPQEISDLFETVRSHLEMIYSTNGELKKMLGDSSIVNVSDQEVSRIASEAGISNINNKEDYRKANNAAKMAITAQFYKTNFGKYCVEKISNIEAFEIYVEKSIRESCNNPAFLQSNGFSDKNEFLNSIGVEPLNIGDSVKEMPERRLFQIANKHYNKLYKAYRKGLLSKGLLDKNKDKTVEEVVNSIIDLPEIEPARMLNQLPDALFFAEALDSKPSEKEASVIYEIIRKIAMQKKENQSLLLKQRLSRFNVDTQGVDDILEKIKNGRR